MITPRDFTISDFLDITKATSDEERAEMNRAILALEQEALHGSVLVDNIIILQFCTKQHVMDVLRDKYQMEFHWLRHDVTPAGFRDIANKYHIVIQQGRKLVVYIPLGQTVDNAALQIDIPDFEITYCYIADANYRLIHNELPETFWTERTAQLRPILAFKRLVLDCVSRGGTDIHFESIYSEDKKKVNQVRYRVETRQELSQFSLDRKLFEQIPRVVVEKLTRSSAGDLDSRFGVVTGVRDLFGDGFCDLRITGVKSDAGYDVTFTIQTVNTTTLTLDELGFPKADVKVLRALAKCTTGLTLITGEVRSGKNTTIFAMLNEMRGKPIRIFEYSNPIENHMGFTQLDYGGDIDLLKEYMRMAKKQDIDIAILNEIPNADVAFAVRDLVNSSIGVVTTTHISRLWNVAYKLREFFGNDYKTIISQLNAVVTQKVFERWECRQLIKRPLVREASEFNKMCYMYGVRQYFTPREGARVTRRFQPMMEVVILTEAMKTAMLNFDEVWRAEQMLMNHLSQCNGRMENKVADYINHGYMPLDQMERFGIGGEVSERPTIQEAKT